MMSTDRKWLGEEVLRTRQKMVRAREQHLMALEDFLGAGGSYGELGRLMGVTRQAARQYVERGRKS